MTRIPVTEPVPAGAQRPRTLAAVALLGFGSGLPVALSFSTLEAWCAVSGLSLKTIGAIKLVALAYVFKFLWAPLIDRFSLSPLGRRRGWMLWMQVGIVVVLVLIAGLSPQTSLPAIALLAVLLATLSATQDIAVDAYRADQLLPRDRGLGAAFGVGGYRVAMVVSGGLALILAGHYGFRFAYLAMAALMGVGIVGTLVAPERRAAKESAHSLVRAYVEPLREFLVRTKAVQWLALILLYKLGNAFALSLSSTFLLRGAGYALSEVGWVNKVFGLAATVVGAFAGGLLLERWSLRRALWVFGVLQGLGALGFFAIALGWQGYPALVTAVAAENFTSGLGTGAFVALLMTLCDKRFSATQYALFSALDSAARIFVGPVAGWIAADYGWVVYFAVSLACALPGLLLLAALHGQFARLDAKSSTA
ncbi:MAG: MFS transporter [Rudaea sp.]|uniref:AmpG family muropeptide MFS transporter n=1 Tax=Rudaea sp. TaxID=2136325 RepID=UPI0039E383A7